MENLSIINQNKVITNRLVRIGDILHFEGPLLVLFTDIQNDHLYVFDWVDRDEKYNRWLVYRIEPQSLDQFIRNQISHLDLFNSNPSRKHFIVDIESNHNFYDYTLQEIEKVPDKYLPEKDNFFEASDCPSIEKIESVLLKLLSRMKQDNEYWRGDFFSESMVPSFTKENGINKITLAYLKTYKVNKESQEFSTQSELQPRNYSPFSTELLLPNGTWNSKAKRQNKLSHA